jgi:hypothetical protein
MRTTTRILRWLSDQLSERITWAGWMYCPFMHLHPYVYPYPRKENR